MTQVYSTKFIEAPGFSGGPSYRYAVPVGFVAVVKCITIVWGNVIASGLDAWVQTDLLTKLVRHTISIPGQTTDDDGGTALYFGSWVLEAGQQLGVQTVAGTCDVWASGYLLSLP
jgi:hypothetical protein